MFRLIASTPDREHQFVVSEHADELEARVAALQAEEELKGLIQTPYVVTVNVI
jgi:hypothetical protein